MSPDELTRVLRILASSYVNRVMVADNINGVSHHLYSLAMEVSVIVIEDRQKSLTKALDEHEREVMKIIEEGVKWETK